MVSLEKGFGKTLAFGSQEKRNRNDSSSWKFFPRTMERIQAVRFFDHIFLF